MRHRPCVRSFLFLAIAALAGCAGQSGVYVAGEQPLQVLVPVMYATDRAVKDRSNPGRFYGSERGSVGYGVAHVAISTKKQGASPVAHWSRWQPLIGKRKNRNELYSVEELSESDFFDVLNTRAAENGNRSALVYIHGYSKKFRTVARNMAITAYGMNLEGIPVLYSWPSKGDPTAYKADVENMRWSAPHLYRFLEDLAAQQWIDTVHVIAHSLGSQGLLQALKALSDSHAEDTPWKLGEIVLFAPDLDTAEFTADVLPWLMAVESRITLYVSAKDVPLQTSKAVNRAPRLGDAKGGILVADGIETVDVTPTISVFVGHSAHRDSPEIQADLHYLVNERLGAASRPTLEPVEVDEGRYWQAVKLP